MTDLSLKLKALGGDIHGPLQEVSVPMYVVDREGTIVWLNDAAQGLVPGATGKRFSDVVTPDLVHPSRRHFALRMLGEEPFVDHRLVLRSRTGEHHEVEISSAPLRESHRIVGVFGVMRSERRSAPRAPEAAAVPKLTPRQHEVLHLLGVGMTTRQMAAQMGLSVETVRNHVRMVLAHLGAKTRLEAVLLAHRTGLLERPGSSSD
jgi:PAS domain S-box-containing protein